MTDEVDAAVVAHRDQYLATLRNHAEYCGDIMDSFIRAGFDRPESMRLMLFHLDQMTWGFDDETD